MAGSIFVGFVSVVMVRRIVTGFGLKSIVANGALASLCFLEDILTAVAAILRRNAFFGVISTCNVQTEFTSWRSNRIDVIGGVLLRRPMWMMLRGWMTSLLA